MTSIASAVVAFVVMVLTGMLRGFPFWITAIVGGLVAALVLFLMERARARRSAEREGEGAT